MDALSGGPRSAQATRWFPDVNFPARVEDVQASMLAHKAPLEAIRSLDRFPSDHVFGRAAEIPALPGMTLHPPDSEDHDAPVDSANWGIRRGFDADTTSGDVTRRAE